MVYCDPEELDFKSAPQFRKTATVSRANVTFARGGEIVTTRQIDSDGQMYVETATTAGPGDAIIRRDENDVYIVRREKFESLYELSEESGIYHSRNNGRAIFLREDTIIRAPWGEDQRIKAGGVLFKNEMTGEIYGNQADSFEYDFARVGDDGSIMSQKESLEVQRAWAVRQGGLAHVRDTTDRLDYKAFQEIPSGYGSDLPWGGSIVREEGSVVSAHDVFSWCK